MSLRILNDLHLNLVSGRIRIFHGVNFVCKAPPWWAVSNYCRGLETSPLSHMTTKIWDQKETQLSSTADLRYWPQLLDDSFARDLNSWGLNIVPHHLTILCQTLHWSLLLSTLIFHMQVRLGVMWSGLEPVEGTYDQEYLDVLRKIIRFGWLGMNLKLWNLLLGILPHMESRLFLICIR